MRILLVLGLLALALAAVTSLYLGYSLLVAETGELGFKNLALGALFVIIGALLSIVFALGFQFR